MVCKLVKWSTKRLNLLSNTTMQMTNLKYENYNVNIFFIFFFFLIFLFFFIFYFFLFFFFFKKWARILAHRVLKILNEAGFSNLQAQVCVHNTKFATAADIVGYCRKINKMVVVELKYCSHSLSGLNRIYKQPDKQNPKMRGGINITNSMYNQHMLQLKETLKLYRKINKNCTGGVLVICADGGCKFILPLCVFKQIFNFYYQVFLMAIPKH